MIRISSLCSLIMSIALTILAGQPDCGYVIMSRQQSSDDDAVWIREVNSESIESIVLHPEKVLEDCEAFWQRDRGYRLTLFWQNSSGISLDQVAWKAGVEELAAVPHSERTRDPAYLMAQEIIGDPDEFIAYAIRFISSFLPVLSKKPSVRIYLTTGIPTSAYMINSIEDYIVINITDPHWRGSPSAIFNAIVHELFHCGYGAVIRREVESENVNVRTTLSRLQNEGMATYCAGLATSKYPAPHEPDYQLFRDMTEVRRRLRSINRLLERAEEMSEDTFRELAWEKGVRERGFYVLGAYMAKCIDTHMGREALRETVISGPLSFIRTYNALVEKRMRVHSISEPTDLSIDQQMRQAALRGDYQRAYELIKVVYERSNPENKESAARSLIGAGNILLSHGQVEMAHDAFLESLRLLPESIGGLYGLAEVSLRMGNRERAIEIYQELLTLDPIHIYPEVQLAILIDRLSGTIP